jgi:hypothetical protein
MTDYQHYFWAVSGFLSPVPLAGFVKKFSAPPIFFPSSNFGGSFAGTALPLVTKAILTQLVRLGLACSISRFRFYSSIKTKAFELGK